MMQQAPLGRCMTMRMSHLGENDIFGSADTSANVNCLRARGQRAYFTYFESTFVLKFKSVHICKIDFFATLQSKFSSEMV